MTYNELKNNFINKYSNFIKFEDSILKNLIDLCIEFVMTQEYLNGADFCNKVHKIPPVKSFLLICEKEINNILVEDYKLESFHIRAIGAFFASVFKKGDYFDYDKTTNVSISKDLKFNVRTASYYHF